MLLEETTIYPFVRNSPELCKLYKFDRNKHITSAGNNDDVWYLISGRVKVEATAPNGKKLLVDIFNEDNYVGHLSDFHEKNFYCDSITMVPCTLIRFPVATFRSLLETPHFSRHFYMKSCARLYDMYKKTLVRRMYTQRQQFAFFITENTQEQVCRIHSIYSIGEYLTISRRNLYNLLERFEAEGIVKRMDTGDIKVLDMNALQKISKPVVDFYYNRI